VIFGQSIMTVELNQQAPSHPKQMRMTRVARTVWKYRNTGKRKRQQWVG